MFVGSGCEGVDFELQLSQPIKLGAPGSAIGDRELRADHRG